MTALPKKYTSSSAIVCEVRNGTRADFKVTQSDSYSRFPAEVRDDPSLSMGARLTYSMLVGFAIDSNRVYPGQQLLADRLGVTTRSVRTYIDELRVANLLRVERRGLTKTNVYILAVWVGSEASPDRKHTSGHERKHISGLERKHASDNNEESDNQEVYNQETNTARPRASVSKPKVTERDLIRNAAKDLKRTAQRPKIEAMCATAGIVIGSLSQRTIDAWTDTFANSPVPQEDLNRLTAYLLSQPWYNQHRERVTASALIRVWPGWVASGRPSSERVATSRATAAVQDRGAQRDEEMKVLAQKIADERGEVFNGAVPSYWTADQRVAHANGGGE